MIDNAWKLFGLTISAGKVDTKVIRDAKSALLLPIIRDKVVPDSIVYTDC